MVVFDSDFIASSDRAIQELQKVFYVIDLRPRVSEQEPEAFKICKGESQVAYRFVFLIGHSLKSCFSFNPDSAVTNQEY